MGRRGFSLTEMLVVLTLATVLAGMSLLFSTKKSNGAKAAAELVAQELIAARESALAKGTPVGIGFPSLDRSSAHCQSFYRLEGQDHARISQVTRLSETTRPVFLFWGHWNASSGFAAPPGQVDSFRLSAWDRVTPREPTIVFLPTGKAIGNIPVLDDAYPVVICEGFTSSAQTVAGSSSHRLVAVEQAYTVSVLPSGAVQLRTGVHLGQGIGAAQIGQTTGTLAPAPALSLGTHNPGALSLELAPSQPASLPAGVDAIVQPGGMLTFTCRSVDRDGESLQCRWNANGGLFSTDEQVEMEWNPAEQAWEAITSWKPPPGATEGDRYQLEAEVSDPDGNSVQASFGVHGGSILVIREERIAFYRLNEGMFTMTAQGGDVREEFEMLDTRYPRFSRDGSKMVFAWAGGLLQIMDLNSGQIKRIFVPTDHSLHGVGNPNFSPDGTKIAFVTGPPLGGPDTCDLYWINTDGSNPGNPALQGPQRLTNLDATPHQDGRRVSFHPQGSHILWEGGNDRNAVVEVYLGTTPPTTRTIYQRGGGFVASTELSPDGTRVVVQEGVAGSGLSSVYVFDYTPGDDANPGTLSNRQLVPNLNGVDITVLTEVCWGGDANHLIVNGNGTLSRQNLDGSVIEPLNAGTTDLWQSTGWVNKGY